MHLDPSHTARQPGHPATALADALRSSDDLWRRLCAVCVWSYPVRGKPIHTDASALELILSALGDGSLHQELRREFERIAGLFIEEVVGAVTPGAVDENALNYWSWKFNFALPSRLVGVELPRFLRDDDEIDDGNYPPELYNPDDMTAVPVMIPEEREKTVWACRKDGTAIVVPG